MDDRSAKAAVLYGALDAEDRDQIWERMEDWTDMDVIALIDACDDIATWGRQLLRERSDARSYDSELAWVMMREARIG